MARWERGRRGTVGAWADAAVVGAWADAAVMGARANAAVVGARTDTAVMEAGAGAEVLVQLRHRHGPDGYAGVGVAVCGHVVRKARA